MADPSAVHAIDATHVGADPGTAPRIEEKGRHGGLGQSDRRHAEVAVHALAAVQPLAVRSKPDGPVRRLGDGDHILFQAFVEQRKDMPERRSQASREAYRYGRLAIADPQGSIRSFPEGTDIVAPEGPGFEVPVIGVLEKGPVRRIGEDAGDAGRDQDGARAVPEDVHHRNVVRDGLFLQRPFLETE